MTRPALVVRYPALLLLALPVAGCGARSAPTDSGVERPAIRIALAAHAGVQPLDQRIRDAQRSVGEEPDVANLEQLARCFIAKARASADPGFYRLAEAAAEAMPSPDAPAALLLRGHVRHALHDFDAAEQIARRLVDQRGMFLDLGLLGDVLLDRGRFEEARDAYQRMLDLKPCLQSYARAAEVRWQQGDATGSGELLELAARAGSQRAPEPVAWVLARRAEMALQAGEPEQAQAFADEALSLVDGYAAALAVRGRAHLATDRYAEAVDDLERAAATSSLPAHLWACAEALRCSGRIDDAAAREARLRAIGEREDPRTFAVWLLTHGPQPGDRNHALSLLEREHALRQDAMTTGALAWAHFLVGDLPAAVDALDRALAAGSTDARLRLHAAEITLAIGDVEAAARHHSASSAARPALLPSERDRLEAVAERL